MVPIDGLGGAKPPGSVPSSDLTSKARTSGSPPESGAPADRAEISDQGLVLVALKGLPATREDLVNELKAAISSGDFDVAAALDSALPGLLDDVSHS